MRCASLVSLQAIRKSTCDMIEHMRGGLPPPSDIQWADWQGTCSCARHRAPDISSHCLTHTAAPTPCASALLATTFALRKDEVKTVKLIDVALTQPLRGMNFSGQSLNNEQKVHIKNLLLASR